MEETSAARCFYGIIDKNRGMKSVISTRVDEEYAPDIHDVMLFHFKRSCVFAATGKNGPRGECAKQNNSDAEIQLPTCIISCTCGV